MDKLITFTVKMNYQTWDILKTKQDQIEKSQELIAFAFDSANKW